MADESQVDVSRDAINVYAPVISGLAIVHQRTKSKMILVDQDGSGGIGLLKKFLIS